MRLIRSGADRDHFTDMRSGDNGEHFPGHHVDVIRSGAGRELDMR